MTVPLLLDYHRGRKRPGKETQKMSNEQMELRRWLQEVTDPELAAELLAIRNEEKEVHERFYRSLEFGTGRSARDGCCWRF